MANDDAWADAQRLEGWAGEVRVNLVRLTCDGTVQVTQEPLPHH